MLTHKLQRLLPIVAFLSACIGVNADTLYLYGGGNSDNPSSWTTPVTSKTVDLSNGTRSITVNDAVFTSAGDHYIAFSKASTNFYSDANALGLQIFFDFSNGTAGTGVSYVTRIRNEGKGSNCYLTYIKYGLSSAVTSLTITMQLDNDYTVTCGTDYHPKKCYELTIASGGAAADPTVTTGSSSSVTNNSALLAGTITYTGTTTITASGIKYYTSSANCTSNTSASTVNTSPTVTTTTGFTVSATGLSASTTYYYKAFATNSSGTGYGSCNSFTTSAAVTETAPVVRWGVAPSIDNQNLVTSAYVAKHGCNSSTNKTVKKLRLYIKSGSAPTTSSFDKMYEFTRDGDYPTGTLYSNTVESDDEWLSSIIEPTTLYMGYVAINDNATINSSEMSDIATITYGCIGQITSISIEPAQEQVKQGQSTTFTARAKSGITDATVNEWRWKINNGSYEGATSSTTSTSTKQVTIPSGSTFTIAAKATHSTCGAKEVFAEYSICTSSIGESVTITSATDINNPIPVSGLGNITFTATLNSGTAYKWEWLLDGVVVNTTDADPETNTNSHTINFSGYPVGDFTVTARATGCPSAQIVETKTLRFRDQLTATNVSGEEFTACPNENRIEISRMFNHTPDNVTVVNSSSVDVTDSEFEYKDGYLYWTATTQDGFDVARTYTVTAHKAGFIDNSATLSFTFTKVIPADEAVITAPASDGTEVGPWSDVTLTATCGGGNTILWSVLPVTASITPTETANGANATFKGKPNDNGTNKTYRIKAQVMSESCGTTTGVIRTVQVTRDEDEECE